MINNPFICVFPSCYTKLKSKNSEIDSSKVQSLFSVSTGVVAWDDSKKYYFYVELYYISPQEIVVQGTMNRY